MAKATPLLSAIGERIAAHRSAANLTQKAVADALGVAPANLLFAAASEVDVIARLAEENRLLRARITAAQTALTAGCAPA